jgi:hypothetical protein
MRMRMHDVMLMLMLMPIAQRHSHLYVVVNSLRAVKAEGKARRTLSTPPPRFTWELMVRSAVDMT